MLWDSATRGVKVNMATAGPAIVIVIFFVSTVATVEERGPLWPSIQRRNVGRPATVKNNRMTMRRRRLRRISRRADIFLLFCQGNPGTCHLERRPAGVATLTLAVEVLIEVVAIPGADVSRRHRPRWAGQGI